MDMKSHWIPYLWLSLLSSTIPPQPRHALCPLASHPSPQQISHCALQTAALHTENCTLTSLRPPPTSCLKCMEPCPPDSPEEAVCAFRPRRRGTTLCCLLPHPKLCTLHLLVRSPGSPAAHSTGLISCQGSGRHMYWPPLTDGLPHGHSLSLLRLLVLHCLVLGTLSSTQLSTPGPGHGAQPHS